MPSNIPFRKEGAKRLRGNAVSARALARQFPLTGNVTLLEATTFVGIGTSTAYSYGIVPMYDASGKRKHTNRVAPFPWLPMPDSLIRTEHGRKLFEAEEIHAWRHAMRARSRQGPLNTATGDTTPCEVTP
jgi:hypothetical protein